MKINEAKHGLNEARGLIYKLILLYIRRFSIYWRKDPEFKENVFCEYKQDNFILCEESTDSTLSSPNSVVSDCLY